MNCYIPVTIIIETFFGEKAYDIDLDNVFFGDDNVVFTDTTGGRLIIYRKAIKTIIDYIN